MSDAVETYGLSSSCPIKPLGAESDRFLGLDHKGRLVSFSSARELHEFERREFGFGNTICGLDFRGRLIAIGEWTDEGSKYYPNYDAKLMREASSRMSSTNRSAVARISAASGACGGISPSSMTDAVASLGCTPANWQVAITRRANIWAKIASPVISSWEGCISNCFVSIKKLWTESGREGKGRDV